MTSNALWSWKVKAFIKINVERKDGRIEDFEFSSITKTSKSQLTDDTNKWKDIPYSWIGRSKTVKWLYYPMQTSDSIQSLSSYQWHFL